MAESEYEKESQLIILILPLLGLLASNIYTSLESKTWYSNLKIVMPDIFNGSYGLYITSFIFIFTGISLFILLVSFKTRFDYTSYTKYLINYPNAYIGMWLLPVIFFLIYIANPIMYQTQNTLTAAILYTIVLVLLLIFVSYIYFVYSERASMFLIPIVIWTIYMVAFLFTITDPSKIKNALYINSDVKNIPIDTIKSNNVSYPNKSNHLFTKKPDNIIKNPKQIDKTPNDSSININKNPSNNPSTQYQIKTGKHLNILNKSLKK